jgi:hypothetical protein
LYLLRNDQVLSVALVDVLLSSNQALSVALVDVLLSSNQALRVDLVVPALVSKLLWVLGCAILRKAKL